MNVKNGTLLLIFMVLLAVTACGCMEQTGAEQVQYTTNNTVEITDMLGRELTVPEDITSVYATSPPSTILVYMLAPEKVAGWNFLNTFNHTLMNDEYLNLPVLGGWFGTQTGNYETIINIHPDIVIEGYTTDGQINEAIERRQESFGNIPVVAVDDSIIFVEDSDPTIEYVGKLLDCEEQATDFINFRAGVLDEIESKVSDIPDDEKVRVYYAEGPKGLATDPSGSQHSQVIDICGGINVANCSLTPGNGMTPVSIEQVIEWNPEVILTSNAQFYNTVYSDPLWENIDAVQNKRVYLSPLNPFCWIDRPQGPHLIIGTAWTATVLYPDLFEDMDMEQTTRDFYSQFLHYNLTDEELKSLLNP
ncbi:iron complex transport system substrate-binding protein [Methanolobus vulcani]|uniref:Iron complex transport system substrate-binding protein n=1 Tax=Methanolobus vulcani TaxID=38026 RepID=A0A7Z7B070_9EURY|nr:iron ABC transporter substrate-binding protein [Methanolobus vulcani]SDG02806.1 iron complex transport system substrate-binding protein [Methanolobus vulcani]